MIRFNKIDPTLEKYASPLVTLMILISIICYVFAMDSLVPPGGLFIK
ncbi:MAG: hypothetical protein HY094_09040 [Candidatus Melainabacteria bacterium]|nr:hypothetical protein [Candidatus Melainabacteria bacterium]